MKPLKASDERFTLQRTVRLLQEFAGVERFDLDVAASPLSCWGVKGFTVADNAFAQQWFGHVFMNPPFSQIGPWIDRMFDQLPNCRSVTALLPADRTEQRWFQQLWLHLVERKATDRVCWLTPREKFGTPEDPSGRRRKNHPPFACFAVHLPGGSK